MGKKILMNTIELANLEDANRCSEILNDGKVFQKAQGFTQWTQSYPTIDNIYEDIKDKKGYVIKVDERIAGYMCIDFSKESAYTNIKGNWSKDSDYAVVHRMAFSKEFVGIGLADIAFKLIEEVCLGRNIPYIRIDTDFPNKRMQHILEKNGFTRCGIIVFEGSEKIAYDKLL